MKIKNIFKQILDFIIVTMNGMAYGLFSTLIIGVIIERIGILTNIEVLVDLAKIVKGLTHIGIGMGVAWALKLDSLKLIVVGISGGLCAAINDPLVTYFVVIVSALLVKYAYYKKTPVDIIIIPLGTLIISYLLYILIDNPIHYLTVALGNFINNATNTAPFIMGIVIAVVMGMALTAPISSAAIAISIGIGGAAGSIAGGAAVVGCCCQMLGFAVMSRKDNNIGMVFSIGVGTSMLQFKNILKKPIIWLPPIIASAILGPIATSVLHLTCTSAGAGMGTSGLVGLFATFDSMGNTTNFWLCLVLLEIILPIAIVFIIDILFRKFNLIKEGDLKV